MNSKEVQKGYDIAITGHLVGSFPLLNIPNIVGCLVTDIIFSSARRTTVFFSFSGNILVLFLKYYSWTMSLILLVPWPFWLIQTHDCCFNPHAGKMLFLVTQFIKLYHVIHFGYIPARLDPIVEIPSSHH